MYLLKQVNKDTHEKHAGATTVIFGLWNKLHVLTETAN